MLGIPSYMLTARQNEVQSKVRNTFARQTDASVERERDFVVIYIHNALQLFWNQFLLAVRSLAAKKHPNTIFFSSIKLKCGIFQRH